MVCNDSRNEKEKGNNFKFPHQCLQTTNTSEVTRPKGISSNSKDRGVTVWRTSWHERMGGIRPARKGK